MTNEEQVDGRHQRSARSRAAVVDAVLDLLAERGELPTAQEIADRAGVSLRTVFRHHDDMDSLLATAVEHQLARVGELFEPMGRLDVDAFVARRAGLLESITGARRAAMRNEARSVIRKGLAEAHRRLRLQVAEAFDIDGELLDAVDAATSWWAWYSLRVEQGMSATRARAVMARTVRGLLAGS